MLISTLACYYDRTKADRFEELFGRTWIGEHPKMCIRDRYSMSHLIVPYYLNNIVRYKEGHSEIELFSL